MALIDGVTAVASASVAVIQEDDAYSALLECANILNGRLAHKVTGGLGVCRQPLISEELLRSSVLE